MKTLIEFENKMFELGKRLFLFSHGEAIKRLAEDDFEWSVIDRVVGKHFRKKHETECEYDYCDAFRVWASGQEYAPFSIYCVEICDYCCDNFIDCKCRRNWYPNRKEWGLVAFGNTVSETFDELIAQLKDGHYMSIDLTHLL